MFNKKNILINFILDYFKVNFYQLIKFIFIGVVTFGINFLSFHCFYGICAFDYKIAVTFAYMLTVISHFILHRVFTFQVKGNEQQLGHNIFKYSLMLTLNYMTTITVMWMTVEIIHGSAYFGLIASTAATASLSFFIMKYFVFSMRTVNN